MKKKKVLCIGLLCEFLACLCVPMSGNVGVVHYPLNKFLDYDWLWTSQINGNYVHIDISRLLVGMMAIAFLTALGYIIAKNDKD